MQCWRQISHGAAHGPCPCPLPRLAAFVDCASNDKSLHGPGCNGLLRYPCSYQRVEVSRCAWSKASAIPSSSQGFCSFLPPSRWLPPGLARLKRPNTIGKTDVFPPSVLQEGHCRSLTVLVNLQLPGRGSENCWGNSCCSLTLGYESRRLKNFNNIISISIAKPPQSQVLVFFSVVIQFQGLDCQRDRAGLTGPQKLVAGLGGSRSNGETH